MAFLEMVQSMVTNEIKSLQFMSRCLLFRRQDKRLLDPMDPRTYQLVPQGLVFNSIVTKVFTIRLMYTFGPVGSLTGHCGFEKDEVVNSKFCRFIREC